MKFTKTARVLAIVPTLAIASAIAIAGIGIPQSASATTVEPVQAVESSEHSSAVTTSADTGASTSELQQSYSANGSIIGAGVYSRVQIDAVGGKKFIGNAGGLFSPGAGVLIGDIYTDNLSRLLSETASFEVNAAAVYTNVNFFNSSGELLGSFQSGSVSTVVGVGGGTGSWA